MVLNLHKASIQALVLPASSACARKCSQQRGEGFASKTSPTATAASLGCYNVALHMGTIRVGALHRSLPPMPICDYHKCTACDAQAMLDLTEPTQRARVRIVTLDCSRRQ